MTIKMAAPFRQTAEVARCYVKLCHRQLQRGFSSKIPLEKRKTLNRDVLCSADKKLLTTTCVDCCQNITPDGLLCRKRRVKPFLCARWYSSMSLEDRKCWQCGAETNDKKELFFCNCGVVQEVPTDLNYFEAMGFDETFDVDLEKLSKLYKDLQKRLHPDKYSQKSEEEQAVADRQSAYINKAYNTLLKPLSRGLYMLELHDNAVEESNTSVDPEFLMLMMEINEELSEHQHDVAVVRKIEQENVESCEKCISSISEAFKSKNIEEAKRLVIKLKYYSNIADKIKEIHRYKMDRWTL